MWETTDPDGRRVVLTAAACRHACEHPEVAPFRAEVLAIVARPAQRCNGREPGEEWFYGRGFGPTRFVKVVVHYEGRVGTIRTAFARRRFP